MAERLISTLVGIIPVVVILPPLMNVIQNIQTGGQIDIMQLINALIPGLIVGSLVPAILEGLAGGE